MKIILAGGSGFIGSHLVPFFRKRGDELILLSRHPRSDERYWDPDQGEIEPTLLAGADVVINLCGESIVGRWSDTKLERIRKSRLHTTAFLVQELTKTPPALYIGASAIGYYGDRGEELLDERSALGHGPLAQLCREWEELHQSLEKRGSRVVCARFGVVLGPDGGALPKMVKPFRLGLGGVLGSGAQYMSWIAIEDLVGAIAAVIDDPSIHGAVNVVAPTPLTNREFTQTLGHLLKKPTLFPVPKWVLTLLFGAGAQFFLASTRVLPAILQKHGYQFKMSELDLVLKKYLRIKPRAGSKKV